LDSGGGSSLEVLGNGEAGEGELDVLGTAGAGQNSVKFGEGGRGEKGARVADGEWMCVVEGICE
jgi:hypothetical protein